MIQDLTKKVWWSYLEEDLQELLKESTLLSDRVEKWNERFHDYAFVVFPAAKAYEGFLKKIFFDLGFISEKAYLGKRFRIGKALNPNLSGKYKKFSVYDKLVEFYQGNELPDRMWEMWIKGRNRLFHWFANEKNAIDFREAEEIIREIVETIDLTFKECKMNEKKISEV